jgi:NAD(P)H dehydrogenase (quinone)
VTEAEVAAALGARYEAVDDSAAVEWLVGQGIPGELAGAWMSTSGLKRDGWYDVVTHAVERLAGRKPTSIEEFFAAQLPSLRRE